MGSLWKTTISSSSQLIAIVVSGLDRLWLWFFKDSLRKDDLRLQMILEYAIISQVITQAMLRDLYWPSRKDGSLLGWPFAHRRLAGPSREALNNRHFAAPAS